MPTLTDRLALIDALRGMALFGVLLVNMAWFAGFENTLTAAQVDALTTSLLDRAAGYGIELLVYAKAIGIFTFLFGVGFALQMQSMQRRGTHDANGTYLRRLTGLLILGLAHWLFLWSGEILHVYAMGGLLLLAVSRWKTRTLLVVGVTLAIFGRPVVGRLLAVLTTGFPTGAITSDAQLGDRFHVFMHGSLVDVVSAQFWQDCLPQITTGVWAAAVVHALGRFMVGAAVARRGYLQNAGSYLRGYFVVLVAGMLIGSIAQRDWLLRDVLNSRGWVTDPDLLGFIGHIANSLGVVALTAAYIAAFVLAWQYQGLRRMLVVFAPVGRTALTAYLVQTPLCYMLFCGFGLGLMGRVGPAGCVALSVLVFAAQVTTSSWWLKRYRMGPVEWLWRWWTYGARPNFRVT